MRVLLFGTYDTSLHPRVATIADGLQAAGAEMAKCNAPLGLDTAAMVGMLASLRGAPAFLARMGRRWLTLARVARGMPAPDVVLVGYLGLFDVHLARLLFRRSQVRLMSRSLAGTRPGGRHPVRWSTPPPLAAVPPCAAAPTATRVTA